jgi:uncharacterized protein (DUF608 family)
MSDPARLFPTDPPSRQWCEFAASGFAGPACGVIHRTADRAPNGMPLGGVDTGCVDLETTGLWGYCTLFNTFTPRRGPLNLPVLGLSTGGSTWVLCRPEPKPAVGEYQYRGQEGYRRWQGDGWVTCTEPLLPGVERLELDNVRVPDEVHYWGHYPVADLEFETDAPVAVGLRAWAPFLPGDLEASMLPGAVFAVHLRNRTTASQAGSVALSFPGPDPREAGATTFVRAIIDAPHQGGVLVTAPLASYALAVLGVPRSQWRTGGALGGNGSAWNALGRQLPGADPDEPGSSLAVDFALSPGETMTLRFALTWCAPTWNGGGYNWAGAPRTYRHMYARHYPDPMAALRRLAVEHESLLARVLAWQQVVYAETALPVWLRESLVNVLHLITEDGLWAQAGEGVPAWVEPADGLFGMNESPRGCPQTECLPNTFYGNQPLVYFFPPLALSTLRGYRGFQFADGAPTWSFGGCTTGTPPADFACASRGYQFATNGISLVAMVDRYLMCHGDAARIAEFFPMVARCTEWTVGLCTTAGYGLGERVIAMPSPDSGEDPPREWFEADYPGWYGLTAHVGLLHLAQLRLAERLARQAGEPAFADRCAAWAAAGSAALEEHLWQGTHYTNCLDPLSGRRSDLVFGFQLDGEWIAAHHGLGPLVPRSHLEATLATVRRCNVGLTQYGAVNYARVDGTPREAARPGTWDYGAYSSFPAEVAMLAMNYMYAGQRDFGLELARRTWDSLICRQGCSWEQPNRTRGNTDEGAPDDANGWVDYFQCMNLWCLPAALAGQDFRGPTQPGGLIHRILAAAAGAG